MHVPVPKGYIDVGLVLIRIASKEPLSLANLRQYACYFEFLSTMAPDVALSR